ncbi:anthranilate synthase component I family protein [Brevundimonas sp.]|uniref:anthranilate synthase component I family protein n=1 Tax=Brevundimonas sp. TaxID=1871086 RepID=UPI002FC6160E
MFEIKTPLAWCDPVAVAAGIKDQPWPLAMVAGAGAPEKHGGRWSFVAFAPDQQAVIPFCDEQFDVLDHDDWRGGPVVGLVSYDAGARQATGSREHVWPDLVLARYPAWLVFDHDQQQVWACGWASSAAEAQDRAALAASWTAMATWPDRPLPPSRDFVAEAEPQAYCDAVAEVVRRIGEGELFQANIARAWHGQLKFGAEPLDVFVRLSRQRGAAYGAWWQAGDYALVSNSPELFLSCDLATRRIETRPIKGTSARYDDPVADAASAQALSNSLKDRAENLMIVDLMRNDLGRVAEVGSVAVERLFELESHPTVHHLTSVVSARLKSGLGWADILRATFPPGSITGAPKHQAMKVIAELEPSRGAWCGSLFVRGMAYPDHVSASVLIRTASFERETSHWRWRAQAGAGITADSNPQAELAETDAKISALYQALFGARAGRAAD